MIGTATVDRVFALSPRRIRLRRTFSVVPPCEAFASLFSYTVFDYRQKKPLKYSIHGCRANFELLIRAKTDPVYALLSYTWFLSISSTGCGFR